ncbi:MAG: hypothetical protein JOZ33_01225, partial [Acidobacteriaceae bacterium]|nr:hypothetical protein [Acidobacteriaceae bacterium]
MRRSLFPVLRLFLALLSIPGCVLGHAQQTPVYPLIETGAHAALVHRIDADAAERYLFSASDDKTIRIWDLRNGTLLRILRPPIGAGNQGKLYAVAASPDGSSVAAGGLTGIGGADQPVYIFDRESGGIRKVITGLPYVTNHLAYSSDGRFLALGLAGKAGIRVYRTGDYAEVNRDDQYGDKCNWAEFDKSGRLITASSDGFIRLYDSSFHLLAKKQPPSGGPSNSVRFSPDGKLISVGFSYANAVDVLSGDSLSPLYTLEGPNPDSSKDPGFLIATLWSMDGQTLCAAGTYVRGGIIPVACWENAGRGKVSTYPAEGNTIADIRALRGGAIAYASADGSVGVLNPTGTVRWRASPDILDMRGQSLRVSSDGSNIEIIARYFDGVAWTSHKLNFSVPDETLKINSETDAALSPPVTTGLAIEKWRNDLHPTLDGNALALEAYERSRSLAITPGLDSFVLGADWHIRRFDSHGKQLWSIPTPGVASQVNITADLRFVVAALGDGTIRWYSFDRGQEVLALFVDRDLRRWVGWNRDGFFTFKGGGDSLIGYQINHGQDEAGEFVKVDQLREVFYRADLIDHILQPGTSVKVLAARNQVGDVSQTLSAGLPPQIELVSSPQADVTDEYRLQFKVRNMGGGVGRVVYRIDGAEIAGRSVDIAGTAQDTINRSIPVGSGPHTLTVAAYSANGKILGKPTTIRL